MKSHDTTGQITFSDTNCALPTEMRVRSARRLTFGAALATGMLLASSCSLPFADDGEDISAQVSVSGTSGELDDDVATGSIPESTGIGNKVDVEEPAQEVTDQTPALSLAIETSLNGRATTYLGIGIELGDLITTNQTLTEYTESTDPTDDDHILIVELAVTNSGNGTASMPREVFGIELASGERIAPEDMRAPDGDFIGLARPAAQSTQHVLLEFVSLDLDGASFVISEAGAIPQYIPLDSAVPVPPPYELSFPGSIAVADLRAPSPWDSCQYLWTGEVVGARVVLDGVDGSQLERAAKGSRWLAIEIKATNDTPSGPGYYPCSTGGMTFHSIEPRLRIDGAAMSPNNNVSFRDALDEGVTGRVEFWFLISADTPEVEFTDVNGKLITSWLLDLPSLPGEN